MSDPQGLHETLSEARKLLEENGYVVIKEKSHKAAQERQRAAQAMLDAEIDRREGSERWARNCLDKERYIRDRLTFVWHVAVSHGATLDELGAKDWRESLTGSTDGLISSTESSSNGSIGSENEPNS